MNAAQLRTTPVSRLTASGMTQVRVSCGYIMPGDQRTQLIRLTLTQIGEGQTHRAGVATSAVSPALTIDTA